MVGRGLRRHTKPNYDHCVNCGYAFLDKFRFKLYPPSLADEVLGCNNPPSAPEILVLLKESDLIAADTEMLDEHISALEQALARLKAHRSTLSYVAQRRKGALSPLRRLPAEILSHIFTICHLQGQCYGPPEDSNSRSYIRPSYMSSSKDAPATSLILSHVAGRWREVALASACLWTHIDLCMSFGGIESQTEMVKHWLLYSQQRHLSVKLSFRLYGPIRDGQACHRGMHLLFSQKHRWEKAQFEFCSFAILSGVE